MALAPVHRPKAGPVGTAPLVREFGGIVIMLFAGWMGGTLVHRNQIGVDPDMCLPGIERRRAVPIKRNDRTG